ncbi:hypothetical protein [Microvirga puerhi]|uniref:Uncharacterized protein n=1 Tax=Microvirga puerhi TaxID=2876078 RepID=A0ABS7VQ84_9HYPH|nr:hypothetical protein [Microvirga puerhi]MBZ6077078.1 hypothetical protein [Microvirga puerhi]
MADLLIAIARAIVEMLIQSVLELVMLGILRILHVTASIALTIFTFGRIQAEPVAHPQSSKPFSIYRQNGSIIIGVGHAVLVGLTLWIAIGWIVIGFVRSD